MKFTRNLLFLLIVVIISCGETPKETEKESSKSSMIDGFWKRTGIVQYVNGTPVDTLYYADGDLDPPGKDFIQMKAFLNGNVFWMRNRKNPNTPWKGAMGGYGKFKIENDSITEFMSHATGNMAVYLKNMKDEAKKSSIPFTFGYSLTDKSYIQIPANPNEDGITNAEYYEKMPSLTNSKLDGVWKRSYEIQFVNGIAIDTTSVPSDAVLDVKIIKDGYFLYQVDLTKLAGDDPEKSQFGGIGGFGEVDYINGDMHEYTQFGSGNFAFDTIPRSVVSYKDIKLYDNDTFLQIDKDTLKQRPGKGLIYRRIE